MFRINRRVSLGCMVPRIVAVTLAALVVANSNTAGAGDDKRVSVVKYDASTETEYKSMWGNIYGELELSAGGTRAVSRQGVTVSAVPFHIGADYSVYDHLKYIAVSTQSFTVPEKGSLEFSVEISATTPGTRPNRVTRGCYGPPGSFTSLAEPCAKPFRQELFEGQQAGVVLNMINFETGQLFDWFVSGNSVFALIERLPTNVTLSPGTGLDLAYTQIIREERIWSARKVKVAIRYTRDDRRSFVEYFLNGKLFAKVDNVGIPLDKQGQRFTGYAPSLGPGEPLKDRLELIRDRAWPVQPVGRLPLPASRRARTQRVDPDIGAPFRARRDRHLGRVQGHDG